MISIIIKVITVLLDLTLLTKVTKHEIVVFQSGDVDAGEKYLRQLVETHPDSGPLWQLLAGYIMRHKPCLGTAAVECAQTSNSLADQSDSVREITQSTHDFLLFTLLYYFTHLT